MEKKIPIIKIVVIAGYLIGALGLTITYPAPDYYFLSWIFGLTTFVILMATHSPWNYRVVITLTLIGVAGWTFEAIGVKTGLIFGDYRYGDSLGIKILETPIMMSVNWIFMIYLVTMSLKDRIGKTYYFLMVGGITMVFYDLLLEPFAIRFDLWSWHNGNPPLHNFIGWFLISLPMLYFCRKALSNGKNALSDTILITQILFYGSVNAVLTFLKASLQ